MMIENKSIKEMLADPDPYVRRDACEAIGDSNDAGFIPDLVEILKDENLGVREAALNALAAIGGARVAGSIVPLLRSDDPAQRNMGVEILESIGTEAVETLATLLSDSDDDVVKFAVDIMANMDVGEKAAGLLAPLVTHPNPNIRASVAVCLGRTRAPGGVTLILKTLKDPEEWVRFSAVEGLGQLEDRSALGDLFGLIEKESGLIQEAAFDAVARLADPSDAVELMRKVESLLSRGQLLNVVSVVELLEKALVPGSSYKPGKDTREVFSMFFFKAETDPDINVRKAALRGCALLKIDSALESVFSFADSLTEIDEDTEAFLVETIAALAGRGPVSPRIIAELDKCGRNTIPIVKALAEIKSVEAVPVLERLLSGAARNENREIVLALEAIASVDSVAALGRLLRNSDGHTRKTASRALGRLAGEEALDDIFEALKKECYRDVTEEMTDVLAMIPSERVMDCFTELLSSDNDTLREMGARGLGMVSHVGAVEALKKACTDGLSSVRKAAYKSMTMLCASENTDTVLKGLKDPDSDVRLTVLKGLSGWSGPAVDSALSTALADENMWVRYHAVLLLGDSADKATEQKIIDVLLKDEPPVKAAAARALEKVGTERSLEFLVNFLDHPDSNVRGAVERAVEALSC